jgi:hypothetical protein
MDQGNRGMNVQLSVNTENLYREETFTDMKYANFRKLTPVKLDGAEDDSRKVVFIASTQVMSPYGPVPVHTQVEADDLADACAKFPDAINTAVMKMVEEMQRQEAQARQQEQSKIFMPGR